MAFSDGVADEPAAKRRRSIQEVTPSLFDIEVNPSDK